MAAKDRILHAVSFDIPYPPTYGGVIDVFFKLKALHEKGVKIHLHCFQYGRSASEQLEKICASVTYYQRNISKSQLFNKLPYIVVSRANDELIENISNDKNPVLFEGLHTSFFLSDERLRKKIKIVRTHNIEHDYYRSLGNVESNVFKRYYFYNEASKLESYEDNLIYSDHVAAISKNDVSYFREKYKNAFYLPAFHSNEQVRIKSGKGHFAFYHGNLSVGENNEAALYLVKNIFSDLNLPLIIAGYKPSAELEEAVTEKNNVTLISDPSSKQIAQLIGDAHVNVLPTFQPTGIKLKLLSSLFNGRFCVVNNMMVENTGLESLCNITYSDGEMKEILKKIFRKDFGERDLDLRKEVLEREFSNETNIEKLLVKLYPESLDLFNQF